LLPGENVCVKEDLKEAVTSKKTISNLTEFFEYKRIINILQAKKKIYLFPSPKIQIKKPFKNL